MASSCSISLHTFPATSPHHHKLITIPTTNPKFTSSSSSHLHSQSQSLSRVPDSSLSCRCSHNSSPPPWDAAFQQLVKSAISKFSSFFNDGDEEADDDLEDDVGDERKTEDVDGAWDWDRWSEHFKRVDEQQRIVSLLKSQLDDAICREEYENASRLKVAIAASVTDDTVGRVISHLNRLLKQELYEDAVSLRDYAGAGLLGWWSGISENNGDPYGRIIRITAEHGRYVARSYSPRQLATSTVGIPLFEIFVANDSKGEYRQQAVYLKRKGISQDFQTMSSRSPTLRPIGSSLSTLSSTEDKSNLFGIPPEDDEDNEDRDSDTDAPESLPGFQNILRDMIPGIKIKILKATPPEKVDTNLISKVIEQIMNEDEENDSEVRDDEAEDEDKVESDLEQDDIEMDSGREVVYSEEGGEIAVKVVVGGLAQKLSGTDFVKDIIRVPARLEKRGRFSFTFTIEDEESEQDANGKGHASSDKRGKLQGQRSMENVMLDLAKFIGREKVPLKVLKDLGELINHSLSQARNGQPLSGSTTFNRIVLPVSPDPLNGLYVGAHGLYTYEVLHLTRKFGQWKDETAVNESSNLEFYEYVEAVKLTGDPHVPAGQVAFRAKVGKRYQLPHKGIIPDEFGVVARYRGQGRLAEPGFKNPRWVDGELVILDGKFIKGGPVVGFVYWDPEHHFLVFFNRVRLQE